MRTKTTSRLSLNIETLRELTPQEARRINGGQAIAVSSAAPPHGGGAITAPAPVSSARPHPHHIGRFSNGVPIKSPI